MTKQEFEARIDGAVSFAEYELINHVYTFHPMIRDVGGKDQIVQLYKLGGMLLMQNMYSYVLECEDCERSLTNAEGRLQELAEMLEGCNDRIFVVQEALETYEEERRKIEKEIHKVYDEANMLRRRFHQLVSGDERAAS